jgi:hypothetical protein
MDKLSALVSFRGLNQHGRIAERTFHFGVSRFHKTPPELAEQGMKLTG